MNDKIKRDYLCVYDPKNDHYLGLGVSNKSKLLFAWLTEDSPLYEADYYDIASFSGPDGCSLQDIANKVKEAFNAKHWPEPETLRGCRFIPVTLDDKLSVIEIHHEYSHDGLFE